MEGQSPVADFGNRIRSLRRAKGLSINAAARAMKINPQSLLNYENGRVPKGKILLVIAMFYGVDVDYLLNGRPAERDPPAAMEIAPDEREMLAVFRDLDLRGRQGLLRWAKFEARAARKAKEVRDQGEDLAKSKA